MCGQIVADGWRAANVTVGSKPAFGLVVSMPMADSGGGAANRDTDKNPMLIDFITVTVLLELSSLGAC
jgi:hypothetical protein